MTFFVTLLINLFSTSNQGVKDNFNSLIKVSYKTPLIEATLK